MRVLSLFAGIGGIDLGLEAHGCTTVAYSEVDPYASSVMAARFPDAVNLGDITAIDWQEVERVEIICGGFPCQDISLAGKGAGIAEGTRSGLWANYADAVRVLRPRGVLVENVAAITSRGLDRVLGDLAACGYDAEWDCIPAAAVGAPHLRDRLFIVAYAGHSETEEWEATASNDPREQGRWILERGIQPDADARVRDHGKADERPGPDSNADGVAVRVQPVAVTGRSCASDPIDDCPATPDASGEGLERRRTPGRTTPQIPGDHSTRDAPLAGWAKPEGSDWWRAEPDVGRVAHGVPRRVDRLRCLGNAVVPQVAEHVAGILMDRLASVEWERGE